MKSALNLAFTSALLVTSSCYALDPVQGFYGGIFLGGNYTSSLQFNYNDQTSYNSLHNGEIKYKIFGNLGGEIGYRMNQFRVETELLFNHSPYSFVTINGREFKTEKSSTGFRFEGQTNTAAFMVNGIYDAFFMGEDMNFAPYIGIGIGYSRITNTVKFYCNDQEVGTDSIVINQNNTCTLTTNLNGRDSNIKSTTSSSAAQAILGVSYFMDDYTMFTVDVRQFATKKIQAFDSKLTFTTFNLGFMGAFDFG